MRAVLDPNVLIAALLSRDGPPAAILTRWLAGEFELVASRALLGELRRALAYPKLRDRIPTKDARRFRTLIEAGAVLAADARSPPRRSSDRGDDYLVALAEATSSVLVSGDGHLLALADELPIRAPRAFLEMLDRSSA